MRHAVVECRSERYLRVEARRRHRPGCHRRVYKTRPAFVRLHTNSPITARPFARVLNCNAERDEVQAALMQWDAEVFRDRGLCRGWRGCDDALYDEWSGLPQARALVATAGE